MGCGVGAGGIIIAPGGLYCWDGVGDDASGAEAGVVVVVVVVVMIFVVGCGSWR